MVQLQSGADNSDWVQVTGKTLQDLLNNMVGMINTGECSDKGSYNCKQITFTFWFTLAN
jgi:hypothetical protein